MAILHPQPCETGKTRKLKNAGDARWDTLMYSVFPLYQAFDVDLRTSCGFTDGYLWHWVLLLLPSYTGWSLLFLALASLIYLPKEPAGAAVRAPSALDVPADCLLFVTSAYHSVFHFLFGLNEYILILGSPPPLQRSCYGE